MQFGSTGLQTVDSSIRFNHDEQVTRAEIILLLRLIKYNQSFASQDDVIETLKYIFPYDNIVKDMSLASTKSSYCIAYGLGPYYHQELVDDLNDHTTV